MTDLPPALGRALGLLAEPPAEPDVFEGHGFVSVRVKNFSTLQWVRARCSTRATLGL